MGKWQFNSALALLCTQMIVAPAAAQTIYDSAGVKIVRNTAAPRLITVGNPLLVIGSADGDARYGLHQIIGAVSFADGRIAVATQGSFSVRFFDSNGKYITAFGRQGTGPREFVVVGDLLRCGALVVATAPDKKLGYVLRSDARHVGNVSLSIPNLGGNTNYVRCNDRFDLIASGWGRITPLPPGPHRPRVPIVLSDSSHSRVRQLGEFDGEERYRHARSDGPHPIGRKLVLGLTPTRAIIGEGNAAELKYFDLSGKLREIVRWGGSAARFTRADRAAFIRGQIQHVNRERRQSVREFYEKLKYPEYLPPYIAIAVDERSRVWVQRYPRPGQNESILDVFTESGKLLATIRIPRKIELFDVTTRRITGKWEDELGIEYVIIFQTPEIGT